MPHFQKFQRVSDALSQGWACWVSLIMLISSGNFFRTFDELSQIKTISNNKFVFLSALRKDNF